MNLLNASMTPEQFQQYQQEQQQAFFRWQQSQVLNREFQDLQQNPPSFNLETSQSLTQPQQVDSPKKGGRKKIKSKRGKNVEGEPQEPVAAGCWLPVEEELLATCYVAVSEDNNVRRSQKHETFWSLSETGSRRKGFLKLKPKKDRTSCRLEESEVLATSTRIGRDDAMDQEVKTINQKQNEK
ncbi:hypothetical protein Tco_1205273 [Tanacetum coccineum]